MRTTTAGMYLGYAIETTAGERPTSGYKIIPEIKSMPDMNPTPETVDSTTLLATEYTTNEPALKSLSNMDYGVNFTDELEEFVDALIQEQEAAEKEGKAVWFCEMHRKVKKASYYTGKASAINFGESSVGAMLETQLHITATGQIKRFERPESVLFPGSTTPETVDRKPVVSGASVRSTKTTNVEV